MSPSVKEMIPKLEAAGRARGGPVDVSQVCSANNIKFPQLNQLGLHGGGQTASQKNSGVLDADAGMPGASVSGWIVPATPAGGFGSFRELLGAVQRVNPKLKAADAYTFSRQLLQPSIISGGRLDSKTLNRDFAQIERELAATATR